MLTLAFNVQPVKAEPTTIIVPDDYPTIQEAINAANSGDTIFVRAGTYSEHITVDKSLILQGEAKENTIIDGGREGNVVTIVANNVTLTGFTVQRSGWWADSAIRLSGSTGSTISKNLIDNYGKGGGIMLYPASGNNIVENEIRRCGDSYWSGAGIWLVSSTNNYFSRNVLVNNRIGIGLSRGGDYNIFVNNNLTGNVLIGAYFPRNVPPGKGNLFYHNNFIDNSNQVHWDASGYPIAPNTWDNGYPDGGNFWSDYTDVDEKSGPDQDLPGSDGIGDTSYVIDEDNVDRYPFMNESGWETLTPEQAILDLIDNVESMNLQQGIDNSLDAKLANVLASLEAFNAEQRNDSINKLYAFINEVEAQRGNKITNEQADYLVSETQRIIDLIQG